MTGEHKPKKTNPFHYPKIKKDEELDRYERYSSAMHEV